MHLSITGLSVRHPSASPGTLALIGASLGVRRGEQVAVIGPSGSGKTTLLQALACALPPVAGTLQLMGEAPWALRRSALHRLRGRLFLAPQVPPLPPRQRVVTAVLAGRLPQMSAWAALASLLVPRDTALARDALARFDLADKLFDRVDRLSGGERQRVGLARALVSGAELLLIDEPLSALDPTRARQAITTLCAAARTSGATLVTTLHQVEVARSRFERIVALRDGRVAFDLPVAAVTDTMLRELYADHEDELGARPVAESADAVEPAAAPIAAPLMCR